MNIMNKKMSNRVCCSVIKILNLIYEFYGLRNPTVYLKKPLFIVF